MKNIFLTGEVGVGKSTVIRKVLSLLTPIVCGGFLTVSTTPISEGAMLDVFIGSAWEHAPRDAAHLVGTRWGDGLFTSYPQTFETFGTSILASPPVNAVLILMDELGIMENDAKLFQKAVMAALNGSLPVLGVIKPKRADFLDAIRAHKNSTIFEVTEHNRDALPLRIVELLQFEEAE